MEETKQNKTLTGPELAERAKKRGIIGEAVAEKYLIKVKKMRLLHRNWRCDHDEIDLIMMDREVLVFVEVRARQVTAMVRGCSTLTRTKKSALRRAGGNFLLQHRGRYPYFRLDVVEVNLCDDEVVDLLHFIHIPVFYKYQAY